MQPRWLLAGALAAAAVAVTAVALARDSTSAEPTPAGFPDNPEGHKPIIFDVGLVSNPGAKEALTEAHSLGADAVRVLMPWHLLAPVEQPEDFRPADPADPNYNFEPYDAGIRHIHKLGMKILLSPTGPAPEWAADPGTGGLSDPDPAKFGAFVSTLAKRYDGRFRDPGNRPPLPRADLWAIWNEPNLAIFLQPQDRDGRPYAPLLYRRLYLAAQEAIHKQQPDAPILIGETAPTGGLDGTGPVEFVHQTLCLDEDFEELEGCPEPDAEIDAVGWSAHPYPLAGQAPFTPVTSPNFVTMSSLASLEATLNGASGADVIPADFPVYITEFGVQSNPDPNAVSLQDQAGFIAIAEHFAYADARVATFAQYLMRDDAPVTVTGEPYGGFESGLRFYDGRRKPSYDAFRLPLALQRLGGKVSLWGIVQPYPYPTTVKIRYKNPGGRPNYLQTITTSEQGIYTTTYGDFPHRLWQAVWSSPEDGKTYRSPWIRSYGFAAPTPG